MVRFLALILSEMRRQDRVFRRNVTVTYLDFSRVTLAAVIQIS